MPKVEKPKLINLGTPRFREVLEDALQGAPKHAPYTTAEKHQGALLRVLTAPYTAGKGLYESLQRLYNTDFRRQQAVQGGMPYTMQDAQDAFELAGAVSAPAIGHKPSLTTARIGRGTAHKMVDFARRAAKESDEVVAFLPLEDMLRRLVKKPERGDVSAPSPIMKREVADYFVDSIHRSIDAMPQQELDRIRTVFPASAWDEGTYIPNPRTSPITKGYLKHTVGLSDREINLTTPSILMSPVMAERVQGADFANALKRAVHETLLHESGHARIHSPGSLRVEKLSDYVRQADDMLRSTSIFRHDKVPYYELPEELVARGVETRLGGGMPASRIPSILYDKQFEESLKSAIRRLGTEDIYEASMGPDLRRVFEKVLRGKK